MGLGFHKLAEKIFLALVSSAFDFLTYCERFLEWPPSLYSLSAVLYLAEILPASVNSAFDISSSWDWLIIHLLAARLFFVEEILPSLVNYAFDI